MHVTDLNSSQLQSEVANLRARLQRAEEAERELASRYRTLFETNPLPMWIFDVDTFAFLAVNDAAVLQYGYTRAEFLKMSIAEIRPPEDFPKVREYILREAGSEHHNAGLWRHRKKDGTVFEVEVLSHSVHWEGKRARLVMARDVTASQRAERALRASEERYRLLFERNLAGVFRTRLDGSVQDCNDAFARIYGYASRQEVLEKNAVDFYFDPADRAHLLTLLKEHSLITNMEYRCRRKDGSPVWLLENVTRIIEPDGEVILEGMIVDITELKRTEAALSESEDRFHAFMDHSPVVAFIKDADGRYVYGNEAWARQFHQERQTLLGKTDADLWPPATARLFRESDAKTLEGRRNFERIEAAAAPDGQLRHWMVFKFPIQDTAGRPFLAGMTLDITEHMRAETALRESEERYRLLADNSTDMISRHTPDGVWLYASPACRTLLGYATGELVGHSAVEIVFPEDATTFRQGLAGATRRPNVAPVSFRLRRKDGGYVWVEATFKGLPDVLDGTVREVLAVTRDITERKRLEEQFIQAQKMEAVGRLAGGVAHDFNNLLTAILGFANLLLSSRPKDDPARPDLEQIKKAGERATGLTRQLMAFSRKQVLRPRVLDLNAIVRDMDKMLRRLIGEDVELLIALAPDLQPVKADPGQVEQVLMNLAVNARDAMPQGGKLTITTGNVFIDSLNGSRPVGLAPGKHVLLRVRDNGCGMDKDTLERLFEPFFTTKVLGKGTGLGLATVYGIVKQSDGQISVDSIPGKGTSFDIYLPAATEPKADSGILPAVPKDVPSIGYETVLLAEDEDVLRALVGVILRQQGYVVLEARNGAEALSRVSNHAGPIHLLVTDVVMPGMNGRQLAEQLTPLRPDMKVLFISGYTDDAIVRHGILDPGVAFLPKPFTPVTLVQKVRDVLDGVPA